MLLGILKATISLERFKKKNGKKREFIVEK